MHATEKRHRCLDLPGDGHRHPKELSYGMRLYRTSEFLNF